MKVRVPFRLYRLYLRYVIYGTLVETEYFQFPRKLYFTVFSHTT